MVLEIDNLREFSSWDEMECSLLKIRTSRSELLYKSVWFMNIKGKLKGLWWLKFEKELE
jgi:hypothetical protein